VSKLFLLAEEIMQVINELNQPSFSTYDVMAKLEPTLNQNLSDHYGLPGAGGGAYFSAASAVMMKLRQLERRGFIRLQGFSNDPSKVFAIPLKGRVYSFKPGNSVFAIYEAA